MKRTEQGKFTYVARVKPYRYVLHCGVAFFSHTPSVADESGLHHFPCRRCRVWHSYRLGEIAGLRLKAGSTRDMEHVVTLDNAMRRDRILEDLRAEWNNESYEVIAAKHGVSDDTVYRIACELGVLDYAETGDNVLDVRVAG